MDNQKMGYLLVVIGVLAAFAITQASTASLPEDLFSDPRFLNCIKDVDVMDADSAMPVYAKCVSFVGRPRFGKRNLPNPFLHPLFPSYQGSYARNSRSSPNNFPEI